jgi:hypothetical protein
MQGIMSRGAPMKHFITVFLGRCVCQWENIIKAIDMYKHVTQFRTYQTKVLRWGRFVGILGIIFGNIFKSGGLPGAKTPSFEPSLKKAFSFMFASISRAVK